MGTTHASKQSITKVKCKIEAIHINVMNSVDPVKT